MSGESKAAPAPTPAPKFFNNKYSWFMFLVLIFGVVVNWVGMVS